MVTVSPSCRNTRLILPSWSKRNGSLPRQLISNILPYESRVSPDIVPLASLYKNLFDSKLRFKNIFSNLQIARSHIAACDRVVGKLLLHCPIHVFKIWLGQHCFGAGHLRYLNKHVQVYIECVRIIVLQIGKRLWHLFGAWTHKRHQGLHLNEAKYVN